MTQAIEGAYWQARTTIQHTIREWLPLSERLDRFESFVLLTIALFTFCWALRKIDEADLREKLSLGGIKKRVFRFCVKRVGFAQKLFTKKLGMIAPSINSSFPPELRSKIHKLPNHKPNPTDFKDESEAMSLRGYLSGSRYPPKQHSDLIAQLSSKFIYSNPLHFNIYPCVRQMEIEVIKMCSKMLNFADNGEAVGAFHSGGTESILMAILGYRQYGRSKGITKPNLLICKTGHVASIKACNYFGIDIKLVDYDSEYCMSLADVKRKIDADTIGVYTSCPNYPYGTIDPIDEIAAYCQPRDIPVHVDMCLGGFLVPFLTNAKGEPIWTVPPGVTTISMDPHKFGLAAKGASILLYASAKMRCHQFFSTSYWPGGLYGTVGICGSRSGSGIASSWISMMKMGMNGYRESAEKVQNAVRKLATALREMGCQLYGRADICTIAFSHPRFPSKSIQSMMKLRDWNLSLMQKPMVIHFSFTPLNSTRVDQLIKDIRESLVLLETSTEKLSDSIDVQLYGANASIPDDATKADIWKEILSCFIDI